MRNPSVTEAYKLYYDNVVSKEHNNPEFIARWGADPGAFETQVMCNKSGIKLDNGKFEDSGEIFGPLFNFPGGVSMFCRLLPSILIVARPTVSVSNLVIENINPFSSGKKLGVSK